jgi:hypothetical protein
MSNRNFVKKKKNTPTRESSKIISRPGSTTNPRNVKALKSSVKKTGVINPSVKGKVNTTKKNTKTRNELIVSALKKAPLGSNKRRKLYDIIGYKQDNTTTGYKKAKSSVKKTGVTTVTPKSKVSVAKKANVAKKVSKVAKKVSTTRAKGVAALASGNKAKALRMKKREARQTKRATRKAKRNK